MVKLMLILCSAAFAAAPALPAEAHPRKRERQLAAQLRAERAKTERLREQRDMERGRVERLRQQRDEEEGRAEELDVELAKALRLRDAALIERDAALGARDVAIGGHLPALPATIAAVPFEDLWRLVFWPLRDRADLCMSQFTASGYVSVEFTSSSASGC
jgi:hypothetical protein